MEVTKDVIEEYKKWYLSTGHSVASTLTYLSFINRYVGNGVDINQKTVDKFRVNNMSCPGSGSLKSFFKFLVLKKHYPDEILNIRFDKNKRSKRLPRSLRVEDVQVLINNMPSLKFKIMTILMFELGLRDVEVIKLRWGDFDWSNWVRNQTEFGSLLIKKTKREKDRPLPVKPELMQLLYNVCRNKTDLGLPVEGLIFDFGLSTYINLKGKRDEEKLYDYVVYVENRFEELVKKIGREKLGKEISPYILRHSKAQFLLDNGMPLSSLKLFLGHEDISTTEIYAQASTETVRKDLIKFDTLRKSE